MKCAVDEDVHHLFVPKTRLLGMYKHFCMHTNMHTHIHAHAWKHTHTQSHAHTHTHIQKECTNKSGNKRALVTGLGILMKNSNNIKRGMSTGDTLAVRVLQTDRVTQHTHYAATAQPLSVMMMAALTWVLPLNKPTHTKLRRGKKVE